MILIPASILSHIQSWDVEEKLVCVLRDNASNMVDGMRVAELPYVVLRTLCN